MFLSEWSGRRVAAYALTWLIGFPVVMTVFAVIGSMSAPGSGGFSVGTLSGAPRDSVSRRSLTPQQVAWRDSVLREMRTRDSTRAAQRRSSDSLSVAFLPAQPSDAVALSFVEDDDPFFGPREFVPWLLPPALLVAAWAWSQRARPTPDD